MSKKGIQTMFHDYFLGLDLGQSIDHSALTVIERLSEAGEWDGVYFANRRTITLAIRHLDQFPLGTPYPLIVERVYHVTQNLNWQGKVRIAIDGTGVGRPVVDLFRERRINAQLQPITVTGGFNESHSRDFDSVPKRDIMMNLRLLLERRGLAVAEGMPHSETLIKELSDLRIKQSRTGREQYEAPSGKHDDLAFSVALAAWSASKAFPKEPAGDARWVTSPDLMIHVDDLRNALKPGGPSRII